MEAYLSAISQATTQSNIAFAVARKALDAMKQEGAGALKLLDDAVKFHDEATERFAGGVARVGAFNGVGESLDVLA